MKFINTKTGDIIHANTYDLLSTSAQKDFIPIEEKITTDTKTHQIIETKSDKLSIGDGVAIAVIVPILFVKSLFD